MATDPAAQTTEDVSSSAVIEQILDAPSRDIGAFSVRRALPAVRRRTVGPFVFFDHMGPATLAPGLGMDVRPHPHIGLATVTWLFEGEIWHRDSLGSSLPIRPGEVNWMIAGRGVVHSERSGDEFRARGGPIEGIQVWLALPVEDEEMEPAFEHYPASALPDLAPAPGVRARVIAGTAFGARSPVGVRSPTLHTELRMEAGGTLRLDNEHEERALYPVSGRISVAGQEIEPRRMVVLRAGAEVTVRAEEASLLMLVGGARLPEPRHLWWNLVSSRPERLAQGAEDWRAGRFPLVPGDVAEHIPAPSDGPLRTA